MTEVPSAYRVVPTLVGAYDWDLVTDVWTWAPELFVMHGLPARGTEVTTELLLRHKHPEDVEYVSATITWARRTGLPFHCLHRVVRADGAERVVVASGRVVRGTDGEPVRMSGSLADVTDSYQGGASEIVDGGAWEPQLADARQALAGQPVIERAKGMVMQHFLLTEEEAWGLLTDVSQRSNTKVRDVARMLVTTSTGRVDPASAGTYELLLDRGRDLLAARGRAADRSGPGGQR